MSNMHARDCALMMSRGPVYRRQNQKSFQAKQMPQPIPNTEKHTLNQVKKTFVANLR